MKRTFWITALKTLVTVAVLGYLVYVVDLGVLFSNFQNAEKRWLLGALVLLPLNLWLETKTWNLFARLVLPALTMWRALGALLVGHTMGFFTPAKVGEYAGRLLYLQADDSWGLGVAIVAERTSSKVIAVTTGIGALVLFLATADPAPRLLWFIVLGYTAASAVLLYAALFFPKHLHRMLLRWMPARWHKAVQYLTALHPRVVGRGLGLAALRYAVYVTQFVLLLRAFGPLVSIQAALLGLVLTYVVKFLLPPITWMDLGIREGAAIYFLGGLGFTEAAALNASLFMFCINIALPALMGIPLLQRLRISRTPHDSTTKMTSPH